MSSNSKKQGYDRRNMFGDVIHYDSKGNKTGESRLNAFGDYVNYDAKGNKTGTSRKDVFGGGFTHYDAKGNKTGRTEPGFLGGFNHYDAKGNKTGSSPGSFMGTYRYSGTGETSSDVGYREPVYRSMPGDEWTRPPWEQAEIRRMRGTENGSGYANPDPKQNKETGEANALQGDAAPVSGSADNKLKWYHWIIMAVVTVIIFKIMIDIGV